MFVIILLTSEGVTTIWFALNEREITGSRLCPAETVWCHHLLWLTDGKCNNTILGNNRNRDEPANPNGNDPEIQNGHNEDGSGDEHDGEEVVSVLDQIFDDLNEKR